MIERKPTAPGRWLATLIAAAILAWASLQASKAVRTHEDLYWGVQALRIWGVPWQFGIAGWTQVRDGLEHARAIEPGNPQVEEYLGRVILHRFDDPKRFDEATPHFVRALKLRPVSPYAWASLAEARYLAGDTGRTFRLALENAAHLGPANPQVQQAVALYGLAVFDEVGPDTRRAIEGMVAAGMRRDPGSLLAIAARRGRTDVACRYLPERKIDPRLLAVCQSSLPRENGAASKSPGTSAK